MSKKMILTIIVGTLAVLTGGIFIIRNEQARISEIPGLGTNEVKQTSESPTTSDGKTTEIKSDTTTMVTKITQITLTVSSPSNNSTVKSQKVAVRGKTIPKAEVFANESEGIADGSGNFSLSVNLDEGSNDIIVTAVDSEGNVAETVVIVTYDAGE